MVARSASSFRLPRARRGRALSTSCGLAWTRARWRGRSRARPPAVSQLSARSSRSIARGVSPARPCMSAARRTRRRGVVPTRGRCEPKRLLGQLGGRRRRATDVRRSGGLLEDRSDVASRARPWRARGGARVPQRMARRRRAARAATVRRAGVWRASNRRAEQRMGESHAARRQARESARRAPRRARGRSERRAPLPRAATVGSASAATARATSSAAGPRPSRRSCRSSSSRRGSGAPRPTRACRLAAGARLRARARRRDCRARSPRA